MRGYSILDTRTVLLIVLGVALTLLLVRLVARRRSAEPRERFKKVSTAYLYDFLVPDGEGGEIHIENALLCHRGIVLVSVKEVSGNVFGSDTMDQWAVITGKRRFTFSNPQDGLYDRTAAVKRLVPDIPVEGHIAFTDDAAFTKGYPKHVIPLSELLATLEQEHKQQRAAPEAFWPSWEKLKSAATHVALEDLAKG